MFVWTEHWIVSNPIYIDKPVTKCQIHLHIDKTDLNNTMFEVYVHSQAATALFFVIFDLLGKGFIMGIIIVFDWVGLLSLIKYSFMHYIWAEHDMTNILFPFVLGFLSSSSCFLLCWWLIHWYSDFCALLGFFCSCWFICLLIFFIGVYSCWIQCLKLRMIFKRYKFLYSNE